MEIMDLYDVNRNRLGKTIARSELSKKNEDEYYQIAHLCIFNSKGDLLIQKRQKDKRVQPNMWDVSVGGCSIAGENTIQAMERETLEEIGYEIDLKGERPYFTMHFKDGFDDFYIVEREIDLEDLIIQKEEVQQVQWASKEKVLQLVAEGKFIDYFFIEGIFEMLEKRGSFRE